MLLNNPLSEIIDNPIVLSIFSNYTFSAKIFDNLMLTQDGEFMITQNNFFMELE
jgi:hypothetical protein